MLENWLIVSWFKPPSAPVSHWGTVASNRNSTTVFPASNGRPLHRCVALNRIFRPTLKRAGLRKVTLHSLRHSFASALIANGSSVVEVAELLGHSNATITLRVYSHFFPSTPSGAVGALASALWVRHRFAVGRLRRIRETFWTLRR
jgi:integrase